MVKNQSLKCLWMLLIFLMCRVVDVNAQIYLQSDKTSAMIDYEDGVEWAVQQKDGFVVAATMSFIKDYGKYYKVDLFVKNLNDRCVVFNPENIKSRLYLSNDTIRLGVYSCEQYLKVIQRQQNLAMIMYGVSAGMNAASASYNQSTSYTYGSDGTSYVTDTYSYNAGAAAVANAQAANEIISLSQMMNEESNVKRQGYLKINTLHCNEAVAGFVNVERFCKGDVFSVRIEVEDTRFYFEWNIKNWKKLAKQKFREERLKMYNEVDTDY